MTTAIKRILSALTGPNYDPKRNGKGWSVRCPAHDDKRPSLSVSEGSDGRALLHCHAGCTAESICAAVGLRLSDLMPNDVSTLSTSTQPLKTREKRQYCRRDIKKPPAYETAKAAIEALECKYGKRSAHWIYRNTEGDPVGMILRWDKPEGKDIRPLARCGDRWTIGGMPEPRPLYCLSDLARADRIYITEGEKAADAARAIGLTATTSAHGSQSPDKTDWLPLAGKECVILPDNDAPGAKYAETVAEILEMLTPAPTVKVVHLPGLPSHGDIANWAEDRSDAHELRRQVECLADEAEVIQRDRPAAHIDRFQPFPTDALPEPVRGFVVAGAKAIGCDTSYLALPMLTALAAAIGNTRRIQLKRGWSAPAIIWTAIVGESGTSKTPAFKLVMQPIKDRQQKALKAHAEKMKKYETELAFHDKAMSRWKRAKETDGPPPEKPDPPHAERYIVSDVTVEALAPLLLTNPRGVLLARDELAGWIGSFDRYAGGAGGGDAAHWLSMHNGESIVVDRKTGNPPTIYVPQASVLVTGGIQPTILHRALGSEHRESGLAARLLLTCPPRKPKQWTEADIDPAAKVRMARLFDRLYDLKPNQDDEEDPCPIVIGLTAAAKTAWKDYYNCHAREQIDLSGELAAAWSKLEEYAARLALVIHYARWAAADPTLENAGVVDVASMEAGIVLAQWFKAETRRVYALLSETDDDQDQRRLIEWIERKGGSVTVRDVQQGHREFPTAHHAETALKGLAKTGYGQFQRPSSSHKGGRPSTIFKLSSPSTSTKPSRTRDLDGFVDVDSVDAPETQPDDEWGEV